MLNTCLKTLNVAYGTNLESLYSRYQDYVEEIIYSNTNKLPDVNLLIQFIEMADNLCLSSVKSQNYSAIKHILDYIRDSILCYKEDNENFQKLLWYAITVLIQIIDYLCSYEEYDLAQKAVDIFIKDFNIFSFHRQDNILLFNHVSFAIDRLFRSQFVPQKIKQQFII